LDKKHTLGHKRNIMHENASGDILVYMDDDDYYPPERISHAVETLLGCDALCAGSSILHIYYPHLDEIVEFGPYGKSHATAGTFALKRELLGQTSYDESASMSEEQHFLKNYTIPFVQLDPLKTILVVAHSQNTFDKTKMLDQSTAFMHSTKLTMDDFIKEKSLIHFYKTDIHKTLHSYVDGNATQKPESLQYIAEMDFNRTYVVKFGDRLIRGHELVDLLNYQNQKIRALEAKL